MAGQYARSSRERAQTMGRYPARMKPLHHSTSISVKLLTRLVRPFYSVEKKSSKEQLRDDFGDFPPAPLRCQSLAGEFDVVRTRGIGEIYHDLVMHKRMLQASDSDTQLLSADFMAFLDANYVLDLRSTLDSLSRGSKFGKRVLISLMLGLMLVKKTARAVRYGRKRPNALGCFVPMLKDELEIIIKAGRHRHKSDAPTVSHEHIHLLQHKNTESHSRHVRSPQDLLSQKGLAEPFLLYLLEKKEVEARLHESVLSYYRTHEQLPVTVSAFLGLLASSQQFGWLVTGILEPLGVPFHRELKTYHEREAMFAEQLEWILIYIKTPELQYRYITEVLPVMYGNLLRYYGDDATSRSFFEDIDRPNFYDDLYGSQAA